MTSALYVLNCLTMLLCSVLLLRAYFNVRRRLLLWSGLSFAAFTVTNAFVIVDVVMYRDIDFYTWRLGWGALGATLILVGLVWEDK